MLPLAQQVPVAALTVYDRENSPVDVRNPINARHVAGRRIRAWKTFPGYGHEWLDIEP